MHLSRLREPFDDPDPPLSLALKSRRWLTGSAGWNYSAATRWILGVRLSFEGLIVDPCIPRDWSGFEVVRQWCGATFRIAVANPDGVEKGVKSISMDGNPVEGPIPPQKAGTKHDIRVTMG